ncbi:MAG: response regulator [Deltaproteobacteria bacterium]|nr:response regulator [Deltaproteobacteria bacterium]
MTTPLHVLVIEDNPADFLLLERHFRQQNLEAVCRRIDSPAQLDLALEESWDLVLADYNLPGMDFRTFIVRIHGRRPELPVLLLSGSVGEETAVELLRLGVADFVLKKHLVRLVPAIRRALDEAAERRARRQAEKGLRESEEKYRMLTENSPDWIFWQGPDGRNKYVSPACLAISGHSPEEFVADSELMTRLIHPEDLDAFLGHLSGRHAAGDTSVLRFRIVRPDGAFRWIDHRCQLMFDEQGTCLGLHGSNRDISEELLLHVEQDSLRNQLHQAQKMESVGRLAGGVAHDFNNKLSVILGYVELALTNPIADEQLRLDLKEVYTAARQSADLTRQLLAFARRQTISPSVLNINATVASMLKMLQRLIGEDISLTWLPAPQVAPVLLDPSQVDQILANLVVNARDAIHGVGKLSIETANVLIDEDYCANHPEAAAGDHVMLAVSDNGCGMDHDLQQQIFEPFFTTKRVGEGTGLGLATVYGIVKQNSGFVNVYSEPGQGTTFKIYFPRHMGGSEAENPAPEGADIPHGSETILLVEDEVRLLTLAQGMLKKLGYRVLAAEDPSEALMLAQTHQGGIDMLLSDVVMPVMNGRELADKLALLCPGIRCLFMSGYTANVIAHQGVLDQGVHFLQKPFSIATLANKVRKILDETKLDELVKSRRQSPDG